MGSGDSFQDIIDATVNGDIVTNYILAIEVMTDRGMDLRLVTSDTMSPWHAIGMLQVAAEMIHTAPLDEKDD